MASAASVKTATICCIMLALTHVGVNLFSGTVV